MKILFVCHANAGRSQVAEALFKKLSKHEAESAGTRVNELLARRKPATNTVKDATGGKAVIAYMKREGLEVGNNPRSQLNLEMVNEADRVIVITSKDTWPRYLLESKKVIFWDIPNAVGMTEESARSVYDQVKRKVEELVSEIG